VEILIMRLERKIKRSNWGDPKRKKKSVFFWLAELSAGFQAGRVSFTEGSFAFWRVGEGRKPSLTEIGKGLAEMAKKADFSSIAPKRTSSD